MKVNPYLDLFTDMKAFLKIKPELLPDSQDLYKQLYGFDPSLDINDEAIRKANSNEFNLNRATCDLEKSKAKGFARDTDMSRYMNPIITASQKTSAENEIEKLDLHKLYNDEPYQQFWLETECVKRTVVEISRLPFYESNSRSRAIAHFIDEVTRIVRIMKAQGKVDVRNHSKQQLNKIMSEFVESIHEIRESQIKLIIQSCKINKTKLTTRTKDEFIEEPVKRPQVVQEKLLPVTYHGVSMKKATQKFSINRCGLPSVYQVDYMSEEQQREELNQHKKYIRAAPNLIINSMRMKRIPTARSSIVIKKPIIQQANLVSSFVNNSDETLNTYWEISDPLMGVREGEFRNPLEDIGVLSKDISAPDDRLLDDSVTLPFQQTACKTQDKQQETKESKMKNNLSAMNELDIEPFPIISSDEVGYRGRELSDDLKFLLAMEPKTSKHVKSLHERLEQIWDKLGFTVQQKLDFVVKYTKDADESAKLRDVLSSWEGILANCLQYDICYIEFKTFLRNGLKIEQNLDDFQDRIDNLEANLIKSYNNLKVSTGDDLYFRRKKITHLIQQRKAKLAYLLMKARERDE